MVDGTLAAPLRQRPLELGADLLGGQRVQASDGPQRPAARLRRHPRSRARAGAARLADPRPARSPGRSRPGSRTARWRRTRAAAGAHGGQRLRARRCAARARRRRRRALARRRLRARLRAARRATPHGDSWRRASWSIESTSFGGVHTNAERRARWGYGDGTSEGWIRFSAGIEDTGRPAGRRRPRARRRRALRASPSAAPPNVGAPMARPTTVHVCSQCGHTEPRWMGQCPGAASGTRWSRRSRPDRDRDCGERRPRGGAAARSRWPRCRSSASRACRPASASSTACSAAASCPARSSCSAGRRASASRRSPAWRSATWRRPAAGRSTSAARSRPPRSRLRAERLGPAALQVPVLAETDLDTVLATIEAERPDVCVIDSVQTLTPPS